MGDRLTRTIHGWFIFNEGTERWQAPDPTDEDRQTAAWKCRYGMNQLTQTECFKLAEVFEAYHHLLTHPGGAEYTVGQLRALRRAVKEKPDD